MKKFINDVIEIKNDVKNGIKYIIKGIAQFLGAIWFIMTDDTFILKPQKIKKPIIIPASWSVKCNTISED